jgi:hypothetical protein
MFFDFCLAYIQTGQYREARDKFDKCLQKTLETNDKVSKQRQHAPVSQEKMLDDIISLLEASLPLKYSMKCQYLTEQQIRQSGQIRTSLKYLNSLSTSPRLLSQAGKGQYDDFIVNNTCLVFVHF